MPDKLDGGETVPRPSAGTVTVEDEADRGVGRQGASLDRARVTSAGVSGGPRLANPNNLAGGGSFMAKRKTNLSDAPGYEILDRTVERSHDYAGPVCERCHQRDNGAEQAAGHPNVKSAPKPEGVLAPFGVDARSSVYNL
jgi:hypothetical protein